MPGPSSRSSARHRCSPLAVDGPDSPALIPAVLPPPGQPTTYSACYGTAHTSSRRPSLSVKDQDGRKTGRPKTRPEEACPDIFPGLGAAPGVESDRLPRPRTRQTRRHLLITRQVSARRHVPVGRARAAQVRTRLSCKKNVGGAETPGPALLLGPRCSPSLGPKTGQVSASHGAVVCIILSWAG